MLFISRDQENEMTICIKSKRYFVIFEHIHVDSLKLKCDKAEVDVILESLLMLPIQGWCLHAKSLNENLCYSAC